MTGASVQIKLDWLKALGWMTLGKRFEAFRRRLEPKGGKLSRALRDDLDLFINGTLAMLRLYRNQSGHPTEVRADRGKAYGVLELGALYLPRLYELKEWFQSHPRVVT